LQREETRHVKASYMAYLLLIDITLKEKKPELAQEVLMEFKSHLKEVKDPVSIAILDFLRKANMPSVHP